jgi:thermitase
LPFRKALAGLLVGIAALLAGPSRADDAPNGLLVKLARNVSAADVNTAHNAYEIGSIPGRRIHVLQPADGRSLSDLCQDLCTDPRVVAVENNNVMSLQATRYYFSHDGLSDQYVNTNVFNQIDDGPLAQWFAGTGVTVALLDTGADLTHPDLIGHLIAGYNFVANTSDPSDVPDSSIDANDPSAVGHGTFNAGIIANVAPCAQIMPLKVLNGAGNGYLSDVLNAIHWAIDHHANVINMSFSSNQPSDLLNEAIDRAYDAGIVVVASAGNDSTGAPYYPAACNHVLGVASVEADDTLSSFSNYGSSISFVAPGDGIRSAFWDGTYAVGAGTSFAAPFVTGLAALLFSAGDNSISGTTITFMDLLTPDQVVQSMQQSGFSVDALNPAYAGQLGSGLIDCDNAIITLLMNSYGQ